MVINYMCSFDSEWRNELVGWINKTGDDEMSSEKCKKEEKNRRKK